MNIRPCRRALRVIGGLMGFALLAASPAAAQDTFSSDHHPLTVETVAENLEHPWGLALLPDGGFLVTERNPGHLRLGTPDGELSGPLEGVPETFRYEGETGRSQAGLFDVRIHPDFERNRTLYLSYSKPTPRGAAMAVVRARLVDDDGSPRLADVEEIFVMNEKDQDSSGLHFGGRMVIDEGAMMLYLTIGERRNVSRSQALDDQAGSILRMTLDGEPAGAARARTTADPGDADEERDPYLWSWGHRNPQAIALRPEDGGLWIADHGPEGGDEVNRIEEGRNYGWPLFTEGEDYSGAPLGHDDPPADIATPVHVFDETVAPSGLAFYTGAEFPGWEGDMLVGGLVTEGIVRLRLGPDDSVMEVESLLTERERRIRDVRVAPDGAVWVITEHSDGEVLRITGADRRSSH